LFGGSRLLVYAAIYRKLGTSSRSQAVSRLRDLGLIEA
jgi:DNA-binding NarL/FixJ family response regulator